MRDALVSAGYPQADAGCGFSGDPDSFAEPLVNADALNVGGSGNPCGSTLVPTDAPPSVRITAPTEGTTVSGTSVAVSATASDDTAVDQVEFFVDGVGIGLGSNTEGSWSIDWYLTGVADGAHTLTATATDTANQTASDSISVTVDNVNDPPKATFTFACSGLTCQFDGSSSTDDRGIAVYAWNFGDGATASGQTATHTFAAAGGYTVALTVTDGGGLTGGDSKLVTVTAAPATLHVADLSGFATSLGNTWTATITITVVDALGKPVSDATVTGSWSQGTLASGSCPTNSAGQCSVTSGSIAKRQGSVTFSVTGITHATLSYDKAANVETSITVAKP